MKRRFNISLYQFGILVMFALRALDYDGTSSIYQITMILVTIGLLVQYFTQKRYTKKEICCSIILTIFAVTITLASKQFAILSLVVVLISSKNVDLHQLIGKILKVHVFFCLLNITGWILGLVPDHSGILSKGGRIIYSYSLGYSHPNIAGLQFLVFLLLHLCYKRSKLVYAYLVSLTIIIYLMCRSRTCLYLSIVSLFFFIFFDGLSKYKKLGKFIFKMRYFIYLYPIMMAFISIGGVYLYINGNAWATLANAITSGRLQLGERYMNLYHIRLFGQEIYSSSNAESYMRLDNGYLNIILRFGLIFFLLFIVAHIICLHKLIKFEKYYECLTIVLFLTYGLTEAYIYNIFINFSLLYLSILMYPLYIRKEPNFLRSTIILRRPSQ